jgi:putative transposase
MGMGGHLGYDKHDLAGQGSGNSRNGTTPKTVLTEVGRWSRSYGRNSVAAVLGQSVGRRQLLGRWSFPATR